MRDLGAAGRHQRHFGGREVDGVSEDRSRGEEVEEVVEAGVVEVGGAREIGKGEEPGDEAAFVQVFRHVCLNREPFGAGEVAESGKGAREAARSEPWGEDWSDKLSFRVDGAAVSDDLLVLSYRVFGSAVAVVVRAGAWFVHTYAADEGALAGGVGEGGEEVGRGDVNGGIVGGGGGAVAESAGDEAGVDVAGVGEVVNRALVSVWERKGAVRGSETRFQGESVGFEPVEEGGGAKEADIRVLWSMNVSV